MNTDYRTPSFKRFLDALQQQSWELELLLSGFVLYGLFNAIEPLREQGAIANYIGNELSVFSHSLALVSVYILIFNLITHIILRGLWIGSLGLRYVSGDINYEKLNYSKKFEKHLAKNIGPFDRYIANLENYCSIIFALTFLLIFYFFSFFIVLAINSILLHTLITSKGYPDWLQVLSVIIFMVLNLGGIIVFIDFITQGLLKKNKWVSKLYFPIYWVFSFITFSFLYRALTYNFLDNKFGKRIIFFLLPIYIIIALIVNIEYSNTNYFNDLETSNNVFAHKNSYRDMLTKKQDMPGKMVIPSKLIQNNYLEITLPYSKDLDDLVFNFDSILKPEIDKRGIRTELFNLTINNSDSSMANSKKLSSLRKKYLKVFNQMHYFTIDGVMRDADFIATTDERDLLGFITYLNIRDLNEGNHVINLVRKKKEKDSLVVTVEETIPFWYFKS
ncbi:hypothetical protein [Flavobacterium sp. ASW18X]|uniref:hypothetical protein n=1 Tax=Flavobacterium sp. ASW18X TaxID=2572595 RepID=UPI0010AEA1EE|nr:hypothetical protein [Flavobacterium sp. ASW18X]TKD58923.1 hypothetical protein FBT53_14755 [Flavobacterium sp. ASW18X]